MTFRQLSEDLLTFIESLGKWKSCPINTLLSKPVWIAPKWSEICKSLEEEDFVEDNVDEPVIEISIPAAMPYKDFFLPILVNGCHCRIRFCGHVQVDLPGIHWSLDQNATPEEFATAKNQIFLVTTVYLPFQKQKDLIIVELCSLPYWKNIKGETAQIWYLPRPLDGYPVRVKFFAHGDVTLCLSTLCKTLIVTSEQSEFDSAFGLIIDETRRYERFDQANPLWPGPAY